MSTEAPVRVGVLGTGRIGSLHAELLAEQVPGTTLTAVFDTDVTVAGAVAERFRARVAASAEELIGADDVDAVAICSSTDTHVESVIATADAGKAMFCEKPISLDLAAVDRALAAVDRSGVLFQVGFNRRFDPGHRSVFEAVTSGAIGDVHLIRISSRDPFPPPVEYARRSGGIFLDMTIHDFDMARYVAGSEVVEVFARGAIRILPVLEEFGDVDTAAVMLIHESGAITLIDNSRQAVYGFDQRVEAFGSDGMAASENPLSHAGLVRTKSGMRAATLPYFFLERYIPSYVREWEAFVRAFREGLPSPVSGGDGRAPLVIGLSALRSLRESRPVNVEEIADSISELEA